MRLVDNKEKKKGGTSFYIIFVYKTQQKTRPPPRGNWLKRLSFENWERYWRKRYRIEGVFGLMKLKVGSSFSLVREDLAKKMAIACAILWNLYMIILLRGNFYDSIEGKKEGIKGLIIFFEHHHHILKKLKNMV